MAIEYRVIGPPGTGKTTWLTRQCWRAAEAVDADRVMVCSFTRAAAAEAAGRESPLPRDNIGTLHSFAYRAIGAPPIAEVKKELVEEWNGRFPAWYIRSSSRSGDDPYGGSASVEAGKNETSGTEYLAEIGMLRGRMIDPSRWPRHLRAFASAWSEFKAETESIDFTDMISKALAEIDTAPGDPAVFFADEGQDFTPLELALAQKWGTAAEHSFIVVGDPDQTLYSWAGADPNALRLSALPEAQRKILGQSYRVPRAVHAEALGWIRRLDGRRDDVEYRPTDFEGAFGRIDHNFAADASELTQRAVEDMAEGQSVMFLALCAYQLIEILAALRGRGIPFGNRYRRKNGAWNPLAPPRRGTTSLAFRLKRFLERKPGEWTAHDLLTWTKPLKGVLERGQRDAIIRVANEHPLECATLDDLGHLFKPAAFEAIQRPTAAWYYQQSASAHEKRLEYLSAVAEGFGTEALIEEPKLTIGTIHSVKGGEADSVYVNVGASPMAIEAIQHPSTGQDAEDALVRTYYVGMTRARQSLTLCGRDRDGVPSP